MPASHLSLTSLYIRNFKNLKLDSPLELGPLNVFIGPNGSGKSNLLGVLNFLRESVLARQSSVGVSEGTELGNSLLSTIDRLGLGRLLDATLSDQENVQLKFTFPPEPSENFGSELDFEIYVPNTPGKRPFIVREEYSTDRPMPKHRERFFYYKFHDRKSGSGVISVYNEPDKISSHFETVEDIPTDCLGLMSIPSFLESSSFAPEMAPVYKVRRSLIEDIQKWSFYNSNNMDLGAIRTEQPKIGPGDLFISPSGENLALVLDNLVQASLDFEEQLLLSMKSVLPTTRKVRTVRSGLNRLAVAWHFEGVRDPFYLHEMSDGTVRMLCWAIVLRSPSPPRLIVLDEPELGLHVSWLKTLAEWIKEAARRTQVIVCTHSPDLLDHFSEVPGSVYRFEKADARYHFSVKRLSPDMVEEKVAEGWQLGDLYRVGDPSIGAWPW